MEALKHNFFLSGYFKKRGYEDSADLAANRIVRLPQATPEKTFTYAVQQLFDGPDSAKMKDQKTLKAAGDFLAQIPVRSRSDRRFHRHGRRYAKGSRSY